MAQVLPGAATVALLVVGGALLVLGAASAAVSKLGGRTGPASGRATAGPLGSSPTRV